MWGRTPARAEPFTGREDVQADFQLFARVATAIAQMIDKPAPAARSERSPFPSFRAERSHSDALLVQGGQLWGQVRSTGQEVLWMMQFVQRCCFTPSSLAAGACYLMRLVGSGRVEFTARTWRSVVLTCMVLAEKYLEDHYVHPLHVRTVFNSMGGGRSPHECTLLELQLFRLLGTQLKVDADEWQQVCFRIGSAQCGVPCQRIFIERPCPASLAPFRWPKRGGLMPLGDLKRAASEVSMTASTVSNTPAHSENGEVLQACWPGFLPGLFAPAQPVPMPRPAPVHACPFGHLPGQMPIRQNVGLPLFF